MTANLVASENLPLRAHLFLDVDCSALGIIGALYCSTHLHFILFLVPHIILPLFILLRLFSFNSGSNRASPLQPQ